MTKIIVVTLPVTKMDQSHIMYLKHLKSQEKTGNYRCSELPWKDNDSSSLRSSGLLSKCQSEADTVIVPISASASLVQGEFVLHMHLHTDRCASCAHDTVPVWGLSLAWATCTLWKVSVSIRAEHYTTVLARKRKTGGQSKETLSLGMGNYVWPCAELHKKHSEEHRNTQKPLLILSKKTGFYYTKKDLDPWSQYPAGKCMQERNCGLKLRSMLLLKGNKLPVPKVKLVRS